MIWEGHSQRIPADLVQLLTRRRVPGELPSDPFRRARDVGECLACGAVVLLAEGLAVCPACDSLDRAAARGR